MFSTFKSRAIYLILLEKTDLYLSLTFLWASWRNKEEEATLLVQKSTSVLLTPYPTVSSLGYFCLLNIIILAVMSTQKYHAQ